MARPRPGADGAQNSLDCFSVPEIMEVLKKNTKNKRAYQMDTEASLKGAPTHRVRDNLNIILNPDGYGLLPIK